MRVDDFDFDLPRGLIARHPCEPRDGARLLFIPASGRFENRQVADLPALLRPGDLLLFNDTKVIPRRSLLARRPRWRLRPRVFTSHKPSSKRWPAPVSSGRR